MDIPTIIKQTEIARLDSDPGTNPVVSTVCFENYGGTKGLDLYETVVFLEGIEVAGLDENAAYRTADLETALAKHNFIEGLITGVIYD